MSARFSSDSFCRSSGSPSSGDVQRRSDSGSRPSQGTPGVELAPAPAAIASEQDDAIHCPDHYEPNYAYPLVVWLVSPDAPPGSLQSTMRGVSERNCFGLAVCPLPGSSPAEAIFEAVTSLRRQYHIHSERIYLAGLAEQASPALEVGLARPEWFAGIVALSPDLECRPRWLAQFDALRGKRVFLGTPEDAPQVERALRMQRLLWTAGMFVHAVAYRGAAEAEAGVLREIDRWMIQGIEQAEEVRTSGFPA